MGTTVSGVPYPEGTAAPNVPAHISAAVQAQDPMLVRKFTSSSNRTTLVPAPTEGQVSYLSDVNHLYLHNGTTWREIPEKVDVDAQVAALTANLTSYTPTWSATTGTPVPGVGGGVTGRYRTLGQQVYVEVELTIGSSGITYTTGFYRFSTPPVAAPTKRHLLNGVLRQSSSYRIHAETDPINNLFVLRADPTTPTGGLQAVDASLPTSWAAGQTVFFSGWYS